MSVIIKGEDGKIINYVKGADVSMIPRMQGKDQKVMNLMEESAAKGLRILLFGMKVFDEGESVESIKNETDDKLEENIAFLGITGLEDLLQDNVKTCIKQLKDAKIKVWMLTGDKGETA